MSIANGVRYGALSKQPGQDIRVNWVYEGDLQKTTTEDEVVNVLNQRIKDYRTLPDEIRQSMPGLL